MSRSGGSEFGAVARVLFDSAAKSGILSEDSRRKFAKQIQRLATQSKHHGGSLADVSTRMSQLVEREAHHKPPTGVAPSKPSGSIASLNIPLRKPRSLSPSPTASMPLKDDAAKQQQPMPSLQIPGLQKVPRADVKPTPAEPPQRSPVAADASKPLTSTITLATQTMQVPKVPPAKEQRTPATTLAMPDMTETVKVPPTKKREVIEITEEVNVDTVLGHRTEQTLSSEPTSFVDRTAPPHQSPRAISKPRLIVPEPAVAQAAVPTYTTPTATLSSVFSTGTLFDGTSDITTRAVGSTISVEDWELQREQEINLLHAAQREREEQLAAAAEVNRQHNLGEEWAQSRKAVGKLTGTVQDPLLVHNETIYFARQWSTVMDAVEAAVEVARGSEKPLLQDYTLMLAMRRMKSLVDSHEERAAIVVKLREIVAPLPNGSLLAESITQRQAIYSRQVPPTSPTFPWMGNKEREPSLRKRFQDAIETGSWESVLHLYSAASATPQRTERNAVLERRTAAALIRLSAAIESTKRSEIADELLVKVRERHKGGVLDRPSYTIFSRLLGGRRGRSILPSLDSPEADEHVLAAHIRFSRPEDIAPLLDQAMKANFNLRDPLVVQALAMKATWDDPVRPFALLREQRSDGVAWNRTHVDTALRAASIAGTNEAADAALEVLRDPLVSVTTAPPALVCNRLFPLLFELKRYDDIIELYSKYKTVLDFPAHMPTATLFVNSALKHNGQKPLSDGDASTLPPRRTREVKSSEETVVGASHSSDSRHTLSTSSSRPTLSSLISEDEMIEHARERNWQAALQCIQRMPSRLTSEESSAATRLYNCAVGASVQRLDILDNILEQMQSRSDVSMNSTTYNTVMSAYAEHDSNWVRALSMYNDMPPQLRDTSTYSVLLNMTAKRKLWDSALGLWGDMKATPSLAKPPVAMYGVGILALYESSWSHTLMLFQELVKTHGIGNVKEVVANRTMKSLEDHKMFGEAQKLTLLLEKLRSKGKKGKK